MLLLISERRVSCAFTFRPDVMIRRLGLGKMGPQRQGVLGSAYLEMCINGVLENQIHRVMRDDRAPSAGGTASGWGMFGLRTKGSSVFFGTGNDT